MFKQLLMKIRKLVKDQPKFDPTQFDDPVAEKVAWTPAKGGGTNFATRKLVKKNLSKIVFSPTIGAIIFYFVFLAVGIVVAAGITYVQYSKGTMGFNTETLLPIGLGLVFAIVGACLLYFGTSPITFDRIGGYFYKGRKNPVNAIDKSSIRSSAELSRIHAIQIISERVRSKNGSYWSYELNLVLDDATRINVVDHGNHNKLRRDAQTLADFLGTKVWDAS